MDINILYRDNDNNFLISALDIPRIILNDDQQYDGRAVSAKLTASRILRR